VRLSFYSSVLRIWLDGHGAADTPANRAVALCVTLPFFLFGTHLSVLRIWLDGYVATDTPANVLSRFEGLRGAGGTFFMLDQLQDQQSENFHVLLLNHVP
jgi:hypothetical protein